MISASTFSPWPNFNLQALSALAGRQSAALFGQHNNYNRLRDRFYTGIPQMAPELAQIFAFSCRPARQKRGTER
jgi:hypothetical protein